VIGAGLLIFCLPPLLSLTSYGDDRWTWAIFGLTWYAMFRWEVTKRYRRLAAEAEHWRVATMDMPTVASKLPAPAVRESLAMTGPVASDADSLLAKQTDGWEYLLFASILRSRRDALDRKFRHFEARRAPRSGRWHNDAGAATYLRSEMDEIQRMIGSLTKLFEPEIVERAFGPLGRPGDPERI
jgi:hypothetical protein